MTKRGSTEWMSMDNRGIAAWITIVLNNGTIISGSDLFVIHGEINYPGRLNDEQ